MPTDEPLVVIGAGGVGLMAVAQAQRMGACAVIVADIDAAKREAALHAGASRAIDGTAPNAVAQIQTATGGGAWAVLDFVGSSQTASLAIAALAKGGTAVVLGLFGGSVTVPTPFLPLRAMTLRGTHVGSHRDIADLPDLVRRTGLPPVPLQTRPPSAVDAALEALRAGRVIGCVVLAPPE